MIAPIKKSWIEFAKQYDINQDCTKYLSLIDMMTYLHNRHCYPQLIFPKDIIQSINYPFVRGMKTYSNQKGFFLQDIIAEAKKINNSIEFIEYLIPPTPPKPPQIDEISDTKTIKTLDFYNLGCWGILIIILVLIYLINISLIEDREVGAFITLLWVPNLLYFAYKFGAFNYVNGSKKVKLSKTELNQNITEAQLKYEKDLQLYREAESIYQANFEKYKFQQRSNMIYIEPLLDEIIWRLLGKFRTTVDTNIARAIDSPQRGRSENILFERLMEIYSKYIKIDMQVGSFFPDICIIIPHIISIDIEIDEPYAIGTKKETHYRGCGDEMRNDFFTNNGWYVLRFSEEQVITQTDKCVQIVTKLINYVRFGHFDTFKDLYSLIKQISTPIWSKEQARLLAIKNSREKY